jgi:hypothetical protein
MVHYILAVCFCAMVQVWRILNGLDNTEPHCHVATDSQAEEIISWLLRLLPLVLCASAAAARVHESAVALWLMCCAVPCCELTETAPRSRRP